MSFGFVHSARPSSRRRACPTGRSAARRSRAHSKPSVRSISSAMRAHRASSLWRRGKLKMSDTMSSRLSADSAATIRLSKTLIRPKSSSFWNVRPMPRRARAAAGMPMMSRPSSVIRPRVGVRNPPIALKSVVFPAPLGPISPMKPPSGTSTVASSTAVRPPKRIVTPSATSVLTLGPRRRGAALLVAGGARAGRRDA